jgi:hypothetical protein
VEVRVCKFCWEESNTKPKKDKGEIHVDNYPAWCRKTWARDRRFF